MPVKLTHILIDEILRLIEENDLLGALSKLKEVPAFRSNVSLLRRELKRVRDDYNRGAITVAERNAEENRIADRIISLVSETGVQTEAYVDPHIIHMLNRDEN